MESLTLQPIARVDGTINLPGSKSVSNRALLLAALAHGKTVLTNLLDSDDVRHMLNALAALGVSYTLSADRTRCEIIGNGGPLHAEGAPGVVPRKRRNGNAPAGGSSLSG